MKNAINLQDNFLNAVRKNKNTITVFLVNGFQIKGTVKGFDNYVVMIEGDGKQNLIYKHAISTIIPAEHVKMNMEQPESHQ